MPISVQNRVSNFYFLSSIALRYCDVILSTYRDRRLVMSKSEFIKNFELLCTVLVLDKVVAVQTETK